LAVFATAAAGCGGGTSASDSTVPVAGPGLAPAPLGVSGNWHLVLSDDFTGTALDPAKWNSNWLGAAGQVTPPVNRDERANYSPAQVTVAGGNLHLTAVALPSVTVGGQHRPYTSGLVNTAGHFQYRYGFAQARIYVPGRAGKVCNWPAFWANGLGRWPLTGENDIMEGGRGRIYYHFISDSGRRGGTPNGDWAGWHTFGADWETGSVTYYYDGRLVGRLTGGITSAPMYLILGLAVGGSYSGPISLPSTLLVDYVEVWQH
jgi:beta-glucanase (GH16 family)